MRPVSRIVYLNYLGHTLERILMSHASVLSFMAINCSTFDHNCTKKTEPKIESKAESKPRSKIHIEFDNIQRIQLVSSSKDPSKSIKIYKFVNH